MGWQVRDAAVQPRLSWWSSFPMKWMFWRLPSVRLRTLWTKLLLLRHLILIEGYEWWIVNIVYISRIYMCSVSITVSINLYNVFSAPQAPDVGATEVDWEVQVRDQVPGAARGDWWHVLGRLGTVPVASRDWPDNGRGPEGQSPHVQLGVVTPGAGGGRLYIGQCGWDNDQVIMLWWVVM